MQKTSIEWVKNPDGTQGYTLNQLTGCRNHVNGMCKGGGFPCYAYRLANGRLRERYLQNPNVAPRYEEDGTRFNLYEDLHDPFYPRFWPERLDDPFLIDRNICIKRHTRGQRKTPRGIFVCDMGELFGDWIPIEWQEQIHMTITLNPQHRFYLLTKQPQNLIKWSPFPDNVYLGVTITNHEMLDKQMPYLLQTESAIRFVIIEPCLGSIDVRFYLPDPMFHNGSTFVGGKGIERWDLGGAPCNPLDWIIIGAMTCSGSDLAKLSSQFPELTPKPFGNRYVLLPKIEWVKEIVDAADKASVAVFLKDNLKPLLLSNPIEVLAQPIKITYEMNSILATADIGGSNWGREGDFAVDVGGAKRLKIKEVLDIKLRQEMPK